jgi:hypothetical protein
VNKHQRCMKEVVICDDRGDYDRGFKGFKRRGLLPSASSRTATGSSYLEGTIPEKSKVRPANS